MNCRRDLLRLDAFGEIDVGEGQALALRYIKVLTDLFSVFLPPIKRGTGPRTTDIKKTSTHRSAGACPPQSPQKPPRL